MNKKILIIYTSIGLGHKVVAESIGQALRTPSSSPPYQGGEREGVEVRLLDLFEMYRGPLVAASEKVYRMLVGYLPWLWRFFYNNALFNKLTLPLRLPFASLRVNKLASYIRDYKPDLILTTQTSATALAAYLKKQGEYRGKLVTTFSDYHFQPYWAYPEVDLYLLNIPEQAGGLKNYLVVGLPVDQAFERDYEEGSVLKEFDLSRTKPLILVMGGSRGWGIRKQDVLSLLKIKYQAQLVVLTGSSVKLAQELSDLGSEADLKIISNADHQSIAKLFSAAKILITKPGGLSVFQAILKNLPMILVNPLPGGEEHNQIYLLGKGVAVAAKDSQSLLAWTEKLLADKKFYQELKQRIKKISPQVSSAEKAASTIIDMLHAQ